MPAHPAPAEPAAGPKRSAAPARGGPDTEAPAKKATSPAAPAAPAGGGRAPSDLKSDWSRLVKLMRERDKMTEALLHSCTVVGLEGQVLRLSTNEFVIKKITGNSATREMIESLLAEVFGFACTLRFEDNARAGTAARADDIPEDGLVATALDLGGEIVDE